MFYVAWRLWNGSEDNRLIYDEANAVAHYNKLKDDPDYMVVMLCDASWNELRKLERNHFVASPNEFPTFT